MRRLFLLSTILVLSNALFSQDLPDWVRNYYDEQIGKEFESENYVGLGVSIPMPNNGIERHMMAIYNALSEYVIRVASVVSIDQNITTMRSKQSVDYTILKDYVDETGIEYVLIKVAPGKHLFTTETMMQKNDNGGSLEIMKSTFVFSAFSYPMVTIVSTELSNGKRNETISYDIGYFKYVSEGVYQDHSNYSKDGIDREKAEEALTRALEEYNMSKK